MGYTSLISFNWTLVMQLVTVLVLFLILKKFFFEKVHNFIKDREQSVKDAFDSAEAVNRKADEKMENYNRQIAKVESDGREIIRLAKEKADVRSREIVDEAHSKAAQLIASAEREIEREKIRAVAEMKTEVTALAMLAASKIMEEELKASGRQEEIVNKIIEEAGRSGWQS